MSVGLPVLGERDANQGERVGVHTKVSLNVRHRVVRPSETLIAESHCVVLESQAQTLAHERVTRHRDHESGRNSTLAEAPKCSEAPSPRCAGRGRQRFWPELISSRFTLPPPRRTIVDTSDLPHQRITRSRHSPVHDSDQEPRETVEAIFATFSRSTFPRTRSDC